MEFTVEDLSPVKKKISVTVAPEEIEASLAAAVNHIKNNAQLDGFRKGKAPASVIKQRFNDEIQKEAHENLINVHINDIFNKLDIQPISGIEMDGEDKPFVKDEPFSYTMAFEVLPTFDLPPYEGLEVDEEKASITEDVLNSVVQRFADEHAKYVPVSGTAPAQDGQVANVDFELIEDGKPKKDFKTTNFDLAIGNNQALKDFEDLVKTIPVGHTGEGDITFPEDFIADDLAGKTVRMKVTVHAVKEKEIPELTDDFVKKLGYKSLDDMREFFKKTYSTAMKNLYKSKSEYSLLNSLCKQVDFELPPSLVTTETNMLLSDYLERMERQGKNAAPDKATYDKLVEEFKPKGEEHAREKIVLLTIAKKENLEVTPEELTREIYNGSQKIGQDFKEYYQKMQDTGLIYKLKENMLCDKAMDIVYERAKINYVEQQNTDDDNDVSSSDKNTTVENQ